MDAVRLVTNGEKLVEAMGYWPSFHDANVLEVSRCPGSFSTTIHVFSMTDQVDTAGYYILEKHHLVTLVMLGVQGNSLPTDYSSDCLEELTFQRVGDMLQINFESVMGQSGTILCSGAEIQAVIPCTSDGVARA